MKIAVIHTTAATLSSLPALIEQEMPGAEVNNLLDDSILPDMNNGRCPQWVHKRWKLLAEIAKETGAEAVISACSTVGEFAEEVNCELGIPVFRIDEAMAWEAVARAGTIVVFATLPSTLGPTTALIQRLAAQQGAHCAVQKVLVPGAYEALMEGDRALHDSKIAQALACWEDSSTSLVLAQASMASAAGGVKPANKSKVLTSPLMGVRFVRDAMLKKQG